MSFKVAKEFSTFNRRFKNGAVVEAEEVDEFDRWKDQGFVTDESVLDAKPSVFVFAADKSKD